MENRYLNGQSILVRLPYIDTGL